MSQLSSLQTLHLLLRRSLAVARETGLGRGAGCPEPPLSPVPKPKPFLPVSTSGKLVFQNLEQGLEVPQRHRRLLSCLLFKCFQQGANSLEAFFWVVYANLYQRRKTQLGSQQVSLNHQWLHTLIVA